MSSKLRQRPELLCLCCAWGKLSATPVKSGNEKHFRELLQRRRTAPGKKEEVNGTADKVEQIKSLTCAGD